MTPLAVYFHWPYCKSKCPYCDFFKMVQKDVSQREIIDLYIKELDYYKHLIPDRQVQSVFFGGGTPSLIEPKYIEKLLLHISKLWPVEKDAEITLEANPNTDRPNMFQDLKSAGINRLSLGVQALNDNDLRFLGRTHNLHQALDSIDTVLNVFNNHSIDLIYARPNQMIDTWLKELEQTVCFGFKHLSLYQLAIEEGTVFERRGVLPLDEKMASKMYQNTVSFLMHRSYPRYEVSNFALPAFQSKHNKCYWQGGEYIGIGQSAHGRLKINNRHIALVYPHEQTFLTDIERAQELVIMGLRLEEGINKKRFKQICHLDFDNFVNVKNMDRLEKEGFLASSFDTVKATTKGFLVLDYLIQELCL